VVGNVIKRGFWLFLVAAIVVAVIRGVPNNPNEWTAWAKTESQKAATFIEENLKKIDVSEYFDWDLNSITPGNEESSPSNSEGSSEPTE